MPKPPKPSSAVIAEFLAEWKQSERYRAQEHSLGLLFKKHYPKNNVLEEVLLKVGSLNSFYSTNIYDTFSVAKHILTTDADARLSNGDQSLVADIATVSIAGKEKYFYSFASKYCGYHKPDAYPMFDSYVETMLWHYQTADSFSDFKKDELRDYGTFCKTIGRFQEYYKLGSNSLREIDIFLWLGGKRWFPQEY